MKKCHLALLPLLAFAPLASASITAVDLELSLLIDVSGSVDSTEYNLMMEGYALAFENTSIQSTIVSGSLGAIAVNVVQFATSGQEVVGWSIIDSAAAANAFATTLRTTPESGSIGGSTGIGEGLMVSADTFLNNGIDAPRQVIDVSGDGDNNTGVDASTGRDYALNGGEVDTINGIVISDSDGSLEQHYIDEVIGGSNPFVTSADDFADFANRILAKLQAEISGLPLSDSGVLAVLRSSQLALAKTSFQDINSRLFRARAGFRGPDPVAVPGGFTSLDDKGSKGGLGKAVIPQTYTTKRWEAFGSIGYQYVDGDEMRNAIPGANLLIIPGYELDLWTGTVGIEYDFNESWSFGGAIIGSDGDIDIKGATADIDVESLGAAIYGTYYRTNAVGGGDFWADLLYGYTDAEYDAGIAGKADGTSHLIDFNTGINFHRDQLTHGPTAGLAYQDNEIEPSGGGSVDFDSLVSSLGYQLSYHIPTSRGDVIPQARLAWEHEFENDPVNIAGLNLGEPDEDALVVGTGVLWQFHQDFYAVLDYEGRFGDNTDSHGILLRIGGTF